MVDPIDLLGQHWREVLFVSTNLLWLGLHARSVRCLGGRYARDLVVATEHERTSAAQEYAAERAEFADQARAELTRLAEERKQLASERVVLRAQVAAIRRGFELPEIDPAAGPRVPFARDRETMEPVTITWTELAGAQHLGIFGMSNVGKSNALKVLAYGLVRQGVQVLVLDIHGDLSTDGITDLDGGVNPLALVSGGGGPKQQILAVTESLGEVLPGRRLSAKQKGVLRRFLLEAYAAAGICEDDPASWSKMPPTFAQVGRLLSDQLDRDFDDVVAAVLTYLQDLLDAGVFAKGMIDWRRGGRVDLSPLSEPAQRLAAEFLLRHIERAVRMDQCDPEEIRYVLVVDEAKFLAGKDSILARYAAQLRKFGVRLVFAGHSERVFSEALDNTPNALVLALSPSAVGSFKSTFRVPEEVLLANQEPGHGTLITGRKTRQVRVLLYQELLQAQQKQAPAMPAAPAGVPAASVERGNGRPASGVGPARQPTRAAGRAPRRRTGIGAALSALLFALVASLTVGHAAPRLGFQSHSVPARGGVQFFGARHYLPGPAIFASPDPGPVEAEDPQSWGRYRAFGGDPIARETPG